MSLFTKSVSFLAVLAVVPAAFAVTARPSIIGNAASRMPTMTAKITGITSGGTITTTTTTSSLLANAECIDAYTACMKGNDACGPDFEECTTKVLFHGKMPQCLSTLAQCNTTGVSSLFGTGTITALSAVATKNSYGEVTDYTYPTDGSVLGQMITGAAISNKYDTSTCVKRYTSCLKKDSVCGDDFELCTTDKEFRKQRIFCDSTLARCQSDGLIELFGSTNTNTTPSATSRIGEMISEGAALAAMNAVSTCYKIADQCITNACAANPFKCYENSTQYLVDLADEIVNPETGLADINTLKDALADFGKKNVSSYIRNSCRDTIGGSKYCYATVNDGKMPTASQLKDEDTQDEIYDDIYSARMNSAMAAKISDMVTDFDTRAKNKCRDTIKSCIMRTCGSGSGAACYSDTFGSGDKTINKSSMYEELQTGCSAITNSDAYCKYAALNPNSAGKYSYQYNNSDAFTTLFPKYDETKKSDPIGVVAALNASLQSSYNDASIAQMRRQCQAVATSCVKSMCGTDYQGCYRNRSDVYSSLTNTGDSSFDKSMNKVGGVLDYTIVLGMCLDTVKSASICEEHLKIEQNRVAKRNRTTKTNDWGTGSVRADWIDAGSATAITADTETVAAVDENGNALCTSKAGNDQAVCYTVDAAGNIYDQPVTVSYTTYVQTQAANSLFKDLIYDLEKEAQAKYNAKLTREQNLCLSENSGGIKGKDDLGSTFQWVKLKSNTVPKSYAMSGLKPNQFVASNDIYGSFCRIRVSLQSDDKKIQDVISKGTDWSVAYFAAGDAFTCGSWIPEKALNDLANAVAKEARDKAARGDGRTRDWMTLLGTVTGGAGGAALGSKFADSNFLGGLTGQSSTQSSKKNAEDCVNYAEKYAIYKDTSSLTRMLTSARKIDTSKNSREDEELKDAISALQKSMMNSNLSNNTTDTTDVYECEITVIEGNLRKDISNMSCGTNAWCKTNNKIATKNTNDNNYTCENSDTLVDVCTYSYKGTGTYIQPVGNTTTINMSNLTKDDINKSIVLCKQSGTVVNQAVKTALSNYNVGTTGAIYINNKGEVVSQRDYRNYANNVSAVDLNDNVIKLQQACEAYSDNKSNQKTKSITTAVGAVGGAIIGGILAHDATKSIQNAKLDRTEQAAYDEWMNDVGNHIRCFVGGNEVGMYGDIISTSLTE